MLTTLFGQFGPFVIFNYQINLMSVLLKFLFLNLVFYVVGAFIAWDTNVENWLLITNPFGRILILFLEFMALRVSLDSENY